MRNLMLAAAAILASTPALAQEAAAPTGADLTLHLECAGERVSTTTETTSVLTGRGAEPIARAPGLATVARETRSPAHVELDVAKGAVRFHPAPAMITGFDRKTADGWYDLTGVVIDRDKIAGRFALNFLDKPTVKVDRHTGDIVVNGFDGLLYEGVCEKGGSIEAQKF